MGKPLPLHERHRALGARLVEHGEWEVPGHYGDPEAEHRGVRAGVGLLDRSCQGKVRLTGNDRVRFLNGMVTNDIKALAPGQGCQAALLNVKGHLLAVVTVTAAAEGFWIETDPQRLPVVMQTLDRYIIGDEVELADESEAWGILGLHGPRAADCLSRLLGTAVPEGAEYTHLPGTLGGIPVRAVRQAYTGDEGFDLWLPREGLAAAWEALWALREAFGLVPVGLVALNTLRVEAGIGWYGVDMDEANLAMEALPDKAVSFTKGCYIGQEVVIRIAHRGHVNKRLVGLSLAGEAVPAPDARVVAGERQVGRVTSAIRSPSLGRVIALGYVHRDFMAVGSKVAVEHDGARVTAEVVELPFYRR
jgi:glycine cleavage system T protein